MIGIITFHAAYNFGSSFQAYATQKMVKKLGYDNEIINYRLNNQLHYYGDFITSKFGKKELVRRTACLKEFGARRLRAKRYEDFIRTKLRTTEKEYHSFEELEASGLTYDILIAGSDQVWNKHCTAEFKTEPPASILPYFLDFQNGQAKRISFSSSLGFMKEDEIREYLPQLKKFKHISVREKDGAEMLGRLLGVSVANTIDPTLLLDRDEWLHDFQSEIETNAGDYILLYSLEKSKKKLTNIQENVKQFAQGKKVVCLAPFLPTHPLGIAMRNDAGPVEFLSLLKNASCMITDSFHGTAFSVNLGIPFYTINTGKDQRKRLLLERVGLENQLLESLDLLSTKNIPDIDYENAWKKLSVLRKESIEYLKNALSN